MQSLSSNNFLNQQKQQQNPLDPSSPTLSSSNNMQQKQSQNNTRRRYSLGNAPPLQQQQQQNDFTAQKYSFLNKQQSFNQNQYNSDLFADQTNLQDQRRFSSGYIPQTSSNNLIDNTYTKILIQQLQQQQQQQQNQENLNNLLKICNSDLSPNYQEKSSMATNYQSSESIPASLSSSLSSISSASQLYSNAANIQNQKQIQNLQNFRRRSFCVSSSLRPVIESRSSSPVYNPYLQQQQQQQAYHQDQLIQHQQQQLYEQKLNLIASSAFLSPPQQNKSRAFSIPSLPTPSPSPQTSSSFSYLSEPKSRPREGSLSLVGSTFTDTTNTVNNSSILLSSSTFNPITANKLLLDSFEEKLATTGNIFQRRDDWSILSQIPINKQNTIHIRLEDEGPYGNDETRCFLLSHFSSLCIKDLSCVFCGCSLVIYDRFPLTDGTLFVSPHMYDKVKSIPCIVANKQQYVNGVCLKCLNGEKDHEIKCKYCKKSWQAIGGFSLQIGTLYKYDVFASFPCCQKRLNCSKCNQKLIDIDSAGSEFFSVFSEEKECPSCKTKAFHFIKPLKEVFIKSTCEPKQEQEVKNEQ